MENKGFRLDRNAFHAGSHDENARYYAANQPAGFRDRLTSAAYLNSIAFRFDPENPPKMDKTAFSMRKHG